MKMIKLIILFILLFFIGEIQGQNVPKNGLAIEFGYGGGDGILPTYIYGLQYTRGFNSWLSGYAKYNLSQGTNGYTKIGEKYILEENTAETPNSRFGQFVFIGVGIEMKIAKTSKSHLYLISGLRYTKSKRSRPVGYLEFDGNYIRSSSNRQKNQFGYEYGIGYKRKFSQKYFVGGSINYANVESRISASLMIGVCF